MCYNKVEQTIDFQKPGEPASPKHRSKTNIKHWIVPLIKDKRLSNPSSTPIVLHPKDRTYKK